MGTEVTIQPAPGENVVLSFIDELRMQDIHFIYLFLIWIFLKSLLNFLQRYFCLMFWFFGQEVCGILVPPPGIEPTPSSLEHNNHWDTREVPKSFILKGSVLVLRELRESLAFSCFYL